jgi:hypothetical protein
MSRPLLSVVGRLTAREIETILAVAGDALASETLSRPEDEEAEYEKDMKSFESGMEKLREMLARRERRAR